MFCIVPEQSGLWYHIEPFHNIFTEMLLKKCQEMILQAGTIENNFTIGIKAKEMLCQEQTCSLKCFFIILE